MNRLLAVLAAMLMLLAACSKPEPPPEPQGTGSTLEDELAHLYAQWERLAADLEEVRG